MKVLAVEAGPAFSVQDVHVGWCEGLTEAGAQVASFNLGDRLAFYSGAFMKRGRRWLPALEDRAAIMLAAKGVLAACYEYRPDVVLITSCFYLPPEMLDTIRSHGTKVVILHTESPYEDDRQVARAGHADVNIVNDPTNLDRFPAGSYYQPHSYRPAVHRPQPAKPEWKCDLAFVGTGYPSRIEFLEAMDLDGLDLLLAGNWQSLTADSPLHKFIGAEDPTHCLDNTDTALLYASARSSLNLYRREAERPELAEGWAMGPREVELAAVGCFYVTEPRGENRAVLPMVPTFTTPDEASDLLRFYLSRDDLREQVTTSARAATADRTFLNAAKRLLGRLD